jgi:hypothetical protein
MCSDDGKSRVTYTATRTSGPRSSGAVGGASASTRTGQHGASPPRTRTTTTRGATTTAPTAGARRVTTTRH